MDIDYTRRTGEPERTGDASADSPMYAQPSARREAGRGARPARGHRSVIPAATAVGIVAIATAAMAGWYLTRPADTTLRPGDPAATSLSAATALQDAALDLAVNTPPASAAAPAATMPPPQAAPRSRSRAAAASPERPVTAPSATGAGVNTAAPTAEPPIETPAAMAVPSATPTVDAKPDPAPIAPDSPAITPPAP